MTTPLAANNELVSRGVACAMPRRNNARAHIRGQSLIESCIVIGLMCLVFLCVFQLSQLFAAKEFLNYTAARGVRAKSVGFNAFMVRKTMRVAVIPNVGAMTSPESGKTASDQAAIEKAQIPLYLGAESENQLQPILDYKDWDSVSIPDPDEDDSGLVSVKVSQTYPLRIPMHNAFYDGDDVELTGEAQMENHHPLYLTDTE
jgi:hypothetical protein